MPDIERVIRGLECCDGYCDDETGCPYFNVLEPFDCEKQLRADAIALLKAQEPVKPQHLHDKSRSPLRCGNCGALIIIFRGFGDDDYKAKFCCECGRAVKWE